MRREDFAERAPGRLIAAQQDASTYRAFVPDPLPPVLTPDMARMARLSEADRAVGELAGRKMDNPQLLIGPFVRREAVLSSRIEGTRTSIAELYIYEAEQLHLRLEGEPEGEPEQDGERQRAREDAHEVFNYVRALEYGLQRLDTLPVSRRLLRELHERLLQGVRGHEQRPGEFRTIQNWISATGATGIAEARFVPPPVAEMEQALDDLEQYINRDETINRDEAIPPLIRIALIHYQFEAIHPFRDGNGRIGRLLITLLLLHWKLLPEPLLYLSVFFEQHRSEYYDRLLAVSQQGAWNAWIAFFLQGVAEQARDAAERAKRLEDLQEQWRTELRNRFNSSSPVILMESLFVLPVLTVSDACKILGVTHRSAQDNIQKLMDAGILQQLGDRRYKRQFYAPEIMVTIDPSSKIK